MYPREMETTSKERDGGGEGKSLAYERGFVRVERFCVIINRIVSTCTGNVLRMICFTLSNSKLHVYVHVAIQLKNNKLLAAIAIEKRNRHFTDHPGVPILGRILERGIKNWPISRTVSILGEIFLERGANLESRAAHTHQKNTQMPPPPPVV